MASKKVNPKSASAKTVESKFSADVGNILSVTEGSARLVTRNQAKLLGQQAARMQSESSTAFGSSSKSVKSLVRTANEGDDIAERVEKVLAQLNSSASKKSIAPSNDDELSFGSTPHNMFAPHVRKNMRGSPPSTMVMHAMTTNTLSVEEQLATLTRAIEGLTKYAQEQDTRIAKLTNMVEGMVDDGVSHAPGKQPQVQEDVDRSAKQVEHDAEIQVSSDGTIPINQIKEFIMGTIKDKYEVAAKSSLTYAKPYTARIDSMKMPSGYQPPKFQQFDSKGNPKQHVAHFIETCNNAGTYGDCLVKQFVRSLKDNAFDWYTDLESGSIDSWEQMEQEFLNRFYSTRRTISMIELTNTRQRNEEPVFDFIN